MPVLEMNHDFVSVLMYIVHVHVHVHVHCTMHVHLICKAEKSRVSTLHRWGRCQIYMYFGGFFFFIPYFALDLICEMSQALSLMRGPRISRDLPLKHRQFPIPNRWR